MNVIIRFGWIPLLLVFAVLFLKQNEEQSEAIPVSAETIPRGEATLPIATPPMVGTVSDDVSSEQPFLKELDGQSNAFEAVDVQVVQGGNDAPGVDEEGGPTEAETAAALEALTGLLPSWMIEQGNLLQDRRDISGHTVLRSRSRYAWENGSSMEIEITDMGDAVDENVVKALGFNPMQSTTNTVDGFSLAYDEDDVLTNHEYDYNDHAGSLQLLIKGRYLIEIQLQTLPLESFQLILDQQLSYDELLQRLE
jgi:hypothetical protein